VLRTLRSFQGGGRSGSRLRYLRTVDPLTFEETVHSAIESAGYMVLRNRRYTGDGGVERCLASGVRLFYGFELIICLA
jgi:restriction system protein